MISDNFHKIFPFSLGANFDQLPVSKAFLAACTAKSTSFSSPAAQLAIFFPVAGSSTSNVLPDFESTQFPFIKRLKKLTLRP